MNERDRRHLDAARVSAELARQHVTAGGRAWRRNQMVVDAAWKRVEEVGEQLRRVSPEQQAAMPGIPWREAKGIRDRVAHDYGTLDLEVLGEVIKHDLPALIAEIDKALSG